MTVNAIWDNSEKTAILLTFEHPWAWQEFETVRDDIEFTLEQVTHEITLIIDTRYAVEIPADALERLSNAYAGVHLHLCRYIIVGSDPKLRTLFNVAERYYSARGGFLTVIFAENLTEARKYSDKHSR